MKRIALAALVLIVIAGAAISALWLLGGEKETTTTPTTLIGNVEGTAWKLTTDELNAADSCATAEAVLAEALAIIDQGKPAAFDLDTLRAHGERRAADEWLTGSCP